MNFICKCGKKLFKNPVLSKTEDFLRKESDFLSAVSKSSPDLSKYCKSKEPTLGAL